MKRPPRLVPYAVHAACGLWLTLLSATFVLMATLPAHASPSYRVTDLGGIPGSSQASSTPTLPLANGYVYDTAGDLAYPFVTTPKLSLDAYWSKLPPKIDPSSGDYKNTMINSNGYLVGIETYLDNKSLPIGYGANPFYAKLGTDGTFGEKVSFGEGKTYRLNQAPGFDLNIIDINSKDQVLGVGLNGGIPTPAIYNIHSGTWTSVFSDIQRFNGANVVEKVLALDDQGRILGSGWVPTANGFVDHLYLLTPDGVTSNPVPVPEPSTLFVMALGMVTPALWSRWRARRLRCANPPA